MNRLFKFLSRWRRSKLSEEEEVMKRLFGGDDIVSQRDALQIEVDRLTNKSRSSHRKTD
jgi:hypothetical protein